MPQKSIALLVSFAILTFVLATGVSAVQAASRMALVISNSQYQDFVYPGAREDGNVVTRALQATGFDVTSLVDVDIDEARWSLEQFAEEASDAEFVVFYFRGAGFESSRGNLLLTSSGAIDGTDAGQVENGLLLEDVASSLSSENYTSLLVIDTRPNGQGRTMGYPEFAKNAAILLSAAPGEIAFDAIDDVSPFARSFATRIGERGATLIRTLRSIKLDVAEVTEGRQRPFYIDGVYDDVLVDNLSACRALLQPLSDPSDLLWMDVAGALEVCEEAAQSNPDDPVARALLSDAEERVAVQRVLATTDVQPAIDYVSKYRNGKYREAIPPARLKDLFGDLETEVIPVSDIPEGPQLEALTLGAASRITISEPNLTRGPRPVRDGVVEITGRIDWDEKIVGVIVDSQPAELLEDGAFRARLTLGSGVRRIPILAVSDTSKFLQESIDVIVSEPEESGPPAKSYAVVIANQNYAGESGFKSLATPLNDANELARILTRDYGFTTDITRPDGSATSLLLHDATARDISMTLYYVSQVATPNDTVLIYYAGHGVYEEANATAFWAAADAQAGVPPTYLSASQIAEAIGRIVARKVILVSDSCFSGELMRGDAPVGEKIDANQRALSLDRLMRDKSRILISSGNNEPVADGGGGEHSVFAGALLRGLERMPYGEFTAHELFAEYVLTAVTANSAQEPQFRPLERVGHEGGDVVFVRTGG